MNSEPPRSGGHAPHLHRLGNYQHEHGETQRELAKLSAAELSVALRDHRRELERIHNAKPCRACRRANGRDRAKCFHCGAELSRAD